VTQSRRMSALEAMTGLVVGYGIAVVLTWWLLDVTTGRAAGVSLVFTVASLVRSYALRRLFARFG
jgi:ABC-type spermidine/putrescine transport system permease subunit I